MMTTKEIEIEIAQRADDLKVLKRRLKHIKDFTEQRDRAKTPHDRDYYQSMINEWTELCRLRIES